MKTKDTLHLIELRLAVMNHAAALREVIGHLERKNYHAAVARLDGAVTELEQISAKQMRDIQAEIRREQIRKGKKGRNR